MTVHKISKDHVVAATMVMVVIAACGGEHTPSLRRTEARVVSVRPVGKLQRTEPVELQFSLPVADEKVGRPLDLASVALVHPRLPAVATFVDAHTLRIEPRKPYTPATEYRLSIRPDVLGKNGVLAGDRVVKFRTLAFGLEDLRGWVTEHGLEFMVRFSHPVDLGEAEAAIALRSVQGTLFPLSVRGGARRQQTHYSVREQGPVRRLYAQVQLPKSADLPSEVIVYVDAGLASTAGGAPLGKTIVRSVPIEPEAPQVESIRPVQFGARWVVAIDLATDVPISRLVGSVRGAGPSIGTALSPDGPWILGAFSPETTASLQIGPPLLPAPKAWVLELPPLAPALRILSVQPLLNLAPGARLHVEHHAVRGLVVTARPVPPELVGLVVDQLVPAQPLPKAWSGPMVGPILLEAEQDGRTPINISPLLDGLPPGLVLIEVQDEQRPWLRDIRYLNRRGLELIVKRRRGYAWTRVQDLQGAVANASIKILGVGGQVLASTLTDSFGTGKLEWAHGTAALAVAEDDTRRYAVLPLRGPAAIRGSGRPERQAWLIPNRVVVAPDQTLDVSVVAHDARNRRVSKEVHVSLQRPRGGREAQTTIELQPDGTGIGEFAVPSSAEVGSYFLRLQDNTGTLLTEVPLKVQRRRLHGARMIVESRDEALTFSVSRAGQSHAEPIHGVCYYQPEDRYGGLPEPEKRMEAFGPIAVEIGRGERQLVRCPAPPGGTRPWSVRLEAHARGAASGQATTLHAPAGTYVEIEMPPKPLETGQPLEAVVKVVDSMGKPATGTVELEILPLEPRLGSFVRPGGRLTPAVFSSTEGELERLKLALVNGSAVIPFVPPHGGSWLIRVGRAAERTVWVRGAEETLRPLSLVLHRSSRGVRAALPFSGRLLLTEEDDTVGRYKASLETSVSSEHRIGLGGQTLTGLLVGTQGRWSAAVLPPTEVPSSEFSVALTVDDVLQPGTKSIVKLEAQRLTQPGVFRLLAVEAASAPSEVLLKSWMAVEPEESALDTLVSAAFDNPAIIRPHTLRSLRSYEQMPRLRPGRMAVATRWLPLRANGTGQAELRWPVVSGRIRVMALVYSGGQLAVTTAERVVGDGLGLDIATPTAVRIGDRLAVPAMLENGSSESKTVTLALNGAGFAEAEPAVTPVVLKPGELKEVRVLADAGIEGPLVISMGETKVSREVVRIHDEGLYWRGRAATAVTDSPAVLPTPEQLGARRASLVVGGQPVLRFSAALQGLLTASPLDGEQAAATVLAASLLPELTRSLRGSKTYRAALQRLPAAFEDADLWVRVCAAHAAIASGKMITLARRTLVDVVASSSDPDAAAYARLLLARLGQAVQGEVRPNSSRADRIAFKVATDALLGGLGTDGQLEVPIVSFPGPRKGRMGPTMVNALALFALESASLEVAASSVLEAALTSAARASRWTHPVEEAMALVALSMRAKRLGHKPYWGYMLFDGVIERRVRSKYVSIIRLDERLSQRPEIRVEGPGSAEVALVLAGQPDRLLSDTLHIDVQQLNAANERIAGRVIEGRPITIVVTVSNQSDQPEKVLIDIPIPAGLEVETAPADATPRIGGYSLTKNLDAQGKWVGRFEATARYAGVWQTPPARVRLRHGRAETFAVQNKLRVEVRTPTRRISEKHQE